MKINPFGLPVTLKGGRGECPPEGEGPGEVEEGAGVPP